VQFLENSNDQLWSNIAKLERRLDAVEKMAKEPRCYSLGEMLPNDALLETMAVRLKAIIDYLGVDIRWHYEDDPSYLVPEIRKVRVWRAVPRSPEIAPDADPTTKEVIRGHPGNPEPTDRTGQADRAGEGQAKDPQADTVESHEGT
jgi:hypothetical protein